MIAPLPDRSPTSDERMRPAAPTETSRSTTRFVDVLAERSSTVGLAPASADDPATAGMNARVFNEDGFFGEALVARTATPTSRLHAASIDEGALPPTSARDAPNTHAVDAEGVPNGGSHRGSRPVPGTAAITTTHAHPDRSTISRPITVPAETGVRRDEAVARDRVAPRAARPLLRPLPRTGSAVTVAVHALARGLEVAAAVANLDPAEQALLADEIAAFLSSHGYPASRIVVVSQQEHR